MTNQLLVLFLFIVSFTFAQNDIEVQEPTYIKSIQLRPAKANVYLPIIKLGERIVLQFDDLEGDEKNYIYKIEHCTYDWKISNISSTVFSSGFTDDSIRDFENSFNTYQNYTHYNLSIPNRNLQIKISGNYLLSVLDEEEEVIFTRKFIVYQPKVDVGVSVHKARKVEHTSTTHNVEFVISHPDLLVNNPTKEIKVAIYQNNDWNTIIKDLKPQYFRGSQMIYKYGKESSFLAGNEFLYFDSKDVRNATNNIRRVVLKDIYNTRLYIDQERVFKPYTYYPDINGNFAVRSINVDDATLESEYSKVHFVLESDFDNTDEDIFVYGAFNNWQLADENKLTYNNKTELYETNIVLKQGFYNYTYVTAKQDNLVNNSTISGSFYQTENEYNVIVYYHKFGSRYDEAIGFGAGSSVNLQN